MEDISIDGATGIIINITGASNLQIHEVNEAMTLIMEAAHEDAEIIFGTVIDESLKEGVKVTVIATGLGGAAQAVLPHSPMIQVPASAPISPAPTTFSQPIESKPSLEMSRQPAPAPMAMAPATPARSSSAQTSVAAPVQAPPQNQYRNPPQPSAAMLAGSRSQRVQFEDEARAQSNDFLATSEVEEVVLKESPIVSGIAAVPPVQGAAAESVELARARAIAQRLGITNLTDDEYDIPTYMRRQQEREM